MPNVLLVLLAKDLAPFPVTSLGSGEKKKKQNGCSCNKQSFSFEIIENTFGENWRKLQGVSCLKASKPRNPVLRNIAIKGACFGR